MFRRFTVTLLTSLSLIASLQAQTTAAVTATTVRIHHVSVLSGILAGPNKEGLTGAELYVNKINKSGGINGRKIEIVSVDDKQDPKLTERMAKELIDTKQVLAFFMPRTSPSVQAMHKLTEVAGVPIIAPQVGPEFIYAPTQRTAFTVRASYAAEVIRAIELQHRLGRRSFAFLAANDAFGNPLVESATKKLMEYSLKPAAVEKVDNRDPNISAALDSFLKSKPEVIFLLCAAKCGGDFVNGFVQRGGTTQFIAVSNNSSNSFAKALGANARGVVVMQVAPLPASRTIRLSKDYSAACAEVKVEPSYAGMVGYIAARVLVEGIRRAGKNLTPATLITSIESMRDFDLGDYFVSYGPNDRVGTNFVEETIISKDGKFLR
jgi:branched-chain amino acid transport system substrate-binding protein